MTDAAPSPIPPADPAAGGAPENVGPENVGPENVGRGSLFALASIPLAVVAYALVGALFGFFAGIVAIIVPPVTAWLYQKGSGGGFSRKAWLPVIAISLVAILVGIFAGFIGTSFAAFRSVGNPDVFGPAFWTTVRNQMTSGDAIVPVLLGVVFGIAALIGLVRRQRQAQAALTRAPGVQPGAPQAGPAQTGTQTPPGVQPPQGPPPPAV